MEEEKAAAYYDELTRKGEGAARFKQGLGFSSSSPSSSFPPKTSSSSLFNNFIRASSPGKAAEIQKQAQLKTIHNKLSKNSDRGDVGSDRGHRSRDQDDGRSVGSRRRPSSRERRSERDRGGHGSRNREEEGGGGGGGGREGYGERRRRRSPTASGEEEDRDREPSYRQSRRSQSGSASHSRESSGGDRERVHKSERSSPQLRSSKSNSASIDYSLLIDGYSQMAPAERVKAKMKLQLSQTAAKDTGMGMSTGWERFDFNKDAPLDDDDEIEVADDDASLVKVIGKSFRFSAAEAKHEEEVKAAHDQAMFGAPAASSALSETESPEENDATDVNEKNPGNVLLSDKVVAMQQGSWRDRARKFQNNSGN